MEIKQILLLALLATACQRHVPPTESKTVKTETDPTLPAQNLPPGVYNMVDSMPGVPADFKEYFVTHFRYPKEAQASNVRGKVFIKAIVGIDGVLSDIHIHQSLEASCDSEALRLVRGMPAWKPGKMAGKLVPVQIMLPIRFPQEKRRLVK